MNENNNKIIAQTKKFEGYKLMYLYQLESDMFELDTENNQVIDENKLYRIEESIINFGQYSAILVNIRNGRVLSGNTRLKAIKDHNKYNPNSQLLVKVEFLDIKTRVDENNISEGMNHIYDEKRENVQDGKSIIEQSNKLLELRFNGERYNGMPLTNISQTTASILGISQSKVKKALASYYKTEEGLIIKIKFAKDAKEKKKFQNELDKLSSIDE